MLEIATIRDNYSHALNGLNKRGVNEAEVLLQGLLEVDKQRRETQTSLDKVQGEANLKSKEIGRLMQAGEKDQALKFREETAALKAQVKNLQEQLQVMVLEQNKILYNLPNLPNEKVPAGKTAEDNQTVAEWGQLPELGDTAKAHWDLIKEYDIIDFDLGNKVTGAGFPFYKGKGAKLVRALVNFCLDQAEAAGYQEIQPPVLVNETSGLATGQLPDKEGQMYAISDLDYYLIPTAEVPITNIYRDVILDKRDLPVKKVGYTPCFRREAGSWGSDVRGLNRLHQFDKVEIVQVSHPDKSYDLLDTMCKHVGGLLQKLGLPYRVLNLCAGDLGFTSAQTFDFEVFSGGQKKWLEVSSVSNFETYQSNRLRLRCRGEDKRNFLLHTLNGSALAVPRVLAAILENGQSEQGIRIPEVLAAYAGFDIIAK